MSPKGHFLNSPECLVTDSLKGLCAINPQLALDEKNKSTPIETRNLPAHVLPVVYIRSLDRSKVALICGGGAGHEPAHAGYVGKHPPYHSSLLNEALDQVTEC